MSNVVSFFVPVALDKCDPLETNTVIVERNTFIGDQTKKYNIMMEVLGNYNVIMTKNRFIDFNQSSNLVMIMYNSINPCLLPNYKYEVVLKDNEFISKEQTKPL